MGANAIATIAIGLTLMLCALYYAPDFPQNVTNLFSLIGVPEHRVKSALTFLNLIDGGNDEPKTVAESVSVEMLLTPDELKKYDGSPDSLGLFLAILGEVFDVEKGAQHYKPGGGYAFFAGRDATRAYITGDFSEAGLVDDLEGIDDVSALSDWITFYKDEYRPVGKVIGRYFSEDGRPTQALLSVRERLDGARDNKWLQDKENEIFPPCNSEWSQEKGSKVWCSKKSGGVDRDWVGVPREFHKKGKDPRCVCVRTTGSASSTPHSTDHPDRGDLDHPGLREYPGCASLSESCSVKHP